MTLSPTSSRPGIPSGGTAGGDLTGTYPNPAVAKVSGVAVSGTPSSGQVPTATGATAATWQTPSGGASGGGALAPARVATTANVASLSGLLTVDGVTVSDGDRVLVQAQTSVAENGIYLAHSGAWTRASDALTYSAMANKLVATGYDGTNNYGVVFVESGSSAPTGPYFVAIAVLANVNYSQADIADTWSLTASSLQVYVLATAYAWAVTTAGYEKTWTMAAPADGTIDASTVLNYYDATNGAAKFVRKGKTADGTVVQSSAPMAPAITSGALPTVALVSGAGTQIALNRDARTVTPVTFNPTGAATATCLVQLSPDNVTYSTLVTKTFPVSVTLAGSIDEVSVIVPAGWYLKLTTTNATLGTTTYY